jgi:hypothetical protein
LEYQRLVRRLTVIEADRIIKPAYTCETTGINYKPRAGRPQFLIVRGKVMAME